jgi:cytoskeletal protein CcmA (bactofilin family)
MATKASSEAVLSAGAHVRGRVVGDGDVRILGTVDGDVSIHGVVVVGEGGVVRGELCEGRDVVVYGELVADVNAEGAVTVHAGGTLRGRVRGRSVRIERRLRAAGAVATVS